MGRLSGDLAIDRQASRHASYRTDDLERLLPRGVDSDRRSLWPELPSAHTPPVSAWSNRRGRTGSTAAIIADKQATRSNYAAIASTPLVDSQRWPLTSD